MLIYIRMKNANCFSEIYKHELMFMFKQTFPPAGEQIV